MKFRRKSLEVEAVQYRAGEQDGAFAKDVVEGRISYAEDGAMVIRTPSGVWRAEPGHWIVRGERGDFSVYSPDIFLKTYEPVPTDPKLKYVAPENDLPSKNWRALHAMGAPVEDLLEAMYNEIDRLYLLALGTAKVSPPPAMRKDSHEA